MAKRRRLTDEQAQNISVVNRDVEAQKRKEEELKKLSDPVEIMKACRVAGKDARSPHKRNWDKNWNLYNNVYDFTLKADWQSKNFVAVVPVIVRGIKYLIKRSVVTAGDFFEVDFPAIPKDSPYKNEVNTWGKKILRKVLDDNKFASLISEATALSLLESLLILKVLPNGNRGVIISTDTAYNIILDPTGRNRWMIHSIPTDFDLVMEKAQAGIYDKVEVDKCFEEFSRQPEASDEATRKQQQSSPTISPPFRKDCVVDEWYGDLIDGQGKVVKKNCSFSVLNEKYLIRKPFTIKEVLDHGKWPIVIGAVNPKPKSVYHQAIVSDVSGLAYMATELLNLTLDSNLMSMAKAFEIDISQIADPADLSGGIVPGKTFKKKGAQPGQQDKPMVRSIDISGPTQQDLMVFENIKNTIQNDVGFYNEFSQGAVGVRPGGRATAREVAERSSNTSASMQSLAEEIEEQVIVPMLEMAWSNMVQYFTDYEQLDGIIPRQLIDFLFLQKDGLKTIFGESAKFGAKGMSGVLNRLEELGKIQQFTGMVRQFPQIQFMLQPKNILESVITNFGWDRNRWMKTDEEIAALATAPAPAVVPPGQGG